MVIPLWGLNQQNLCLMQRFSYINMRVFSLMGYGNIMGKSQLNPCLFCPLNQSIGTTDLFFFGWLASHQERLQLQRWTALLLSFRLRFQPRERQLQRPAWTVGGYRVDIWEPPRNAMVFMGNFSTIANNMFIFGNPQRCKSGTKFNHVLC